MFTDATFTADMLSNPTKLAKAVVDAMEATDTTAVPVINDPNNGFIIQLAAYVALYARFTEKVDEVYSYFYPQRSRNAQQLYPHLSQFDFTDVMAQPATLPFSFAMSKAWIISNSVPYDVNYNKIEIPATSVITMGNITYGMYYPIEILVNRNTGAVTAFYDTTVSNSLNTLATNMVNAVREYTLNGIAYFEITFNMYQFSCQVLTSTASSGTGFLKTYQLTDQFYSIKVASQNFDGSWSDIPANLTTLYYDYTTPTALLTPIGDGTQIQVEIPQIYFDNGQVGQTVRVELYTTRGSVNYSLSLQDVTGLSANFDTSSSVYAAPLAQMPTWDIVPTTTEVAGGSNAMTYAQIRDAVVNQRLYDRVAVTAQELYEVGQKAGFTLTRVIDDLTERMYYATNILTDANAMAIPTFAGNILIADDALIGNPSTILSFTDGYYTILPTTLFRTPDSGSTCSPMSDGAVAQLAGLTKADLVTELNTGTYLRQPFHITLLTTPKSPQTMIYNLLSPMMSSLVFNAENAHSAPMMSVTSCTVTHNASGTGGYTVVMGVKRSSNIQSSDAGNFQVYVTCKNKLGSFVYLPAVYQGTSGSVDTWQINLATNYHITTDNYIQVGMYDTTDTLVETEISLDQSFIVVTAFTASFAPTVLVDSGLNVLLPPSKQGLEVVMANQTMEIVLGTNLSNQIYCGVNTSWGNDVYKTADDAVYYTTAVPIFQTNAQGQIVTRVGSDHSVQVVQLYDIGDTPSDTQDISLGLAAAVPVPASGATTTVVPFLDVTGLLVGMACRGTSIPVDTTITHIAGLLVTLSNPITTALVSGAVLVFTNPHFLTATAAVQSAPGHQLTVASTAGYLVGQSVFGFDIPTGNTIASIDSPTQFSLTAPTTVVVADATLLTILNTTAYGVVKVAKGQILTDATGTAIVIKDAQNQYSIPIIMFDGRLFASDSLTDQATVSQVSGYLQNYANQIATLDAGLIESSEVYYKPARTMGQALFGIGNNLTEMLSLEMWFSVTVYLDPATYTNTALKTTMTNTIITVVNAALGNPIISISAITEQINTALGVNAVAVEMGGINGDDSLRLVALEQTDVKPCIEYVLTLQSDGTIARSPHVDVTFLPQPATADATNLIT